VAAVLSPVSQNSDAHPAMWGVTDKWQVF